MNTLTSARDALVAYINDAWTVAYPGVPIYYENTTKIDLDTAPPVFLMCSIDFTDSIQSDIDLGDEGDMTTGEVVLRLFSEEGTGVRSGLGMFDFLRAAMKLKIVSGVRTQVPHPGRKQSQSGWVSADLVCPFMFYSKY